MFILCILCAHEYFKQTIVTSEHNSSIDIKRDGKYNIQSLETRFSKSRCDDYIVVTHRVVKVKTQLKQCD